MSRLVLLNPDDANGAYYLTDEMAAVFERYRESRLCPTDDDQSDVTPQSVGDLLGSREEVVDYIQDETKRFHGRHHTAIDNQTEHQGLFRKIRERMDSFGWGEF